MKPVLSQEEIDALMAGLKSGEIDAAELEEKEQTKVKDYDFRRPIRLSKEYIGTLNMVFEEYAKMVANLLTTQVHQNVAIELKSIEQVSFDEFLHSVPRFTMMGIFHSDPQPGIQIVELNPQICFQLIELLCGNVDGANFANNEDKDHFTEIEMAILEDVMVQFGIAFQAAWRDIVSVDTHMSTLETNSQMIQTMSPNEPVAMLTFRITILNNQSFVNLCIPYVFFESILDKLSLRNWFHTGKGTDVTDVDKIRRNLQGVPLDMEVSLGKTMITLENFLQLELGDIVPLNKRITEPLVLSVEKQPYCLVKPGVHGTQMAVEILQEIGGDGEE